MLRDLCISPFPFVCLNCSTSSVDVCLVFLSQCMWQKEIRRYILLTLGPLADIYIFVYLKKKGEEKGLPNNWLGWSVPSFQHKSFANCWKTCRKCRPISSGSCFSVLMVFLCLCRQMEIPTGLFQCWGSTTTLPVMWIKVETRYWLSIVLCSRREPEIRGSTSVKDWPSNISELMKWL